MDKQGQVSKDIFLVTVKNLGNIRRWELKDSPVVQALAEFAYKYQIRDLQIVDDLVERIAPLLQAGNAMTSVPEFTSDSLLTSDFLADRILPWVELVRTELFGSRNAPFHSIRQSEQWIGQQAKDQRLLPLSRKLDERFKRLISTGRIQVAVPPEHTFEYMGEDGKVHQITIRDYQLEEWKTPESRPQYTNRGIPALTWLENETRIMARSTGFTQPSLVQFVLVGVRPVLPRYLVRGEAVYQVTPANDILQPFHLEIEIRARDLSFEELRQIYHTYRRTQPRKAKAFNEEHRAIYRLVNEKGGPVSGKGSVRFWKSIMEIWNTLHPEKRRYSHWKGIKIAHERIIRRLDSRLKTRTDDKRQ